MTANATGPRTRGFLGPIAAIGGVQLMAAMDGPVALFALTEIQRGLGLSDSMRNAIITAYMVSFGGLILLGGRLGDALGRKRVFIAGVVVFTAASALCGVAWDGGILVVARLLHGAAAALVVPTCMALLASTFPKGPVRNWATAVFSAMAAIGVVIGIVVGGVLTGVSWRLAFLINVPIGVAVVWLARTRLTETPRVPQRLDAAGASLSFAVCAATVVGLALGPERGWLSPVVLGSGAVALLSLLGFVVAERRAASPVVPFDLFADRDRAATFVASFLVRGVGFTLTVVVALSLENIMGYSPLRAGLYFIPLALAMAAGSGLSSWLVARLSPRVIVVAASLLVLGTVLYCAALLSRGVPHLADFAVPMLAGAAGIGMINVPLGLALIASVGLDRIGPVTAIAAMLQSLGGPMVLVFIQAVITMSTGGATPDMGPLGFASAFSTGLRWLAVFVVLLAAAAMAIRYTAEQVGQARENKRIFNEQAA